MSISPGRLRHNSLIRDLVRETHINFFIAGEIKDGDNLTIKLGKNKLEFAVG